ncbi:hypothetical protein [Frondihabitans sp. PAMC 28766]|nr:hypothetical protein [Frondihabitans sp. PAMC 28766]
MDAHADEDFDHIALTREGVGGQGQWGLLVCSSAMAYPGEPS